MELKLLTLEQVIKIHDLILNQGELQGLAMNKSLEGALGRIDFRIDYGMVKDAYDLAAAYGLAVATGHVFNDGNKRTAYRAMTFSLRQNGIHLVWPTEVIGDKIREVAQGKVDEMELATWLRVSKRLEG